MAYEHMAKLVVSRATISDHEIQAVAKIELLVSNDGMNGPCSTGLCNPHRVMGRYAPHAKPVAFEEQAVLIQWAQCLRWPICKAWLLLAHGVFDSARGPPWMPSASDSR